MDTDILEFQTFMHGSECIHKFSPFNAEIREVAERNNSSLKVEELDTVVVAAREEGFEREFMGNSRWFAIRIHASMLDKLKYIAVYQVAPISAITYYGEIAFIEKWNDTNKYLINLKGPASKIGPVPLDKDKKGLAPQAPRYTSLDRVLKAKKMSQVF